LHVVLNRQDLLHSGKLSVLKLLKGRKSAFSPRRGDSLHRFTSRSMCTWVRLLMWNFTPIGARVWVRGPKSRKFTLFGKVSPRRGEPLDRFGKVLWDFIRPTILHYHVTFDVIRFTRYEVIAEKPRVGHLPWIFPCILQEKLCVVSKYDCPLLIFGLWVNLLPPVCRFATNPAGKNIQTPHFRTYSRRNSNYTKYSVQRYGQFFLRFGKFLAQICESCGATYRRNYETVSAL